MFTNKVRCSIILVLKEKTLGAKRKVFGLHRSLIYARVRWCAWGAPLKIDQSRLKLYANSIAMMHTFKVVWDWSSLTHLKICHY